LTVARRVGKRVAVKVATTAEYSALPWAASLVVCWVGTRADLMVVLLVALMAVASVVC
jgi:hypothetical protein